MPRIVLVGAGSVEFTRNLLGDILTSPALRSSHIALHDIDPERLGDRRADGPLDGRLRSVPSRRSPRTSIGARRSRGPTSS